MQHSTSRLMTQDGHAIHTEAWLPEATPRAAILLVHGYAEHIGRYAHTAQRLVRAGYAVYGMDHRGHGKSEGPRAYFESAELPLHDLQQFYEQVRAEQPDRKLFMLGHSMGTLLSLHFVLRQPDALDGLILSGTAIHGGETVAPALRFVLRRFVRPIAPTLALVPAIGSEQLSTDPAVARAYDNDPLVYRKPWRVGMAAVLLDMADDIHARAQEIRLPLLVLHGSEDAIAPVSGSHALYEKATSEDKTLHTFPGMRHEILNEVDKDKVFQVIQDWLAQRL